MNATTWLERRMPVPDPWTLTSEGFDPAGLHHGETIFTIGNGYLAPRGACEEGYPDDWRATFVHGVFDYAPMVGTELVNAPDWLSLSIILDGEPFAMTSGTIEAFEQRLDLSTGLLTRTVRWRVPEGAGATLLFERFASLADEHLVLLRCTITPEAGGRLEVRAGLNGYASNDFDRGTYRLLHWRYLDQGERDGATYLVTRTNKSDITLACAMRVRVDGGTVLADETWRTPMVPTRVITLAAQAG